jgi:hypothetical protein
MKFKRVFVKGGIKRMKYTVPAFVFSLFRISMELLNRPQSEEETEEIKDENGLVVKLQKVD